MQTATNIDPTGTIRLAQTPAGLTVPVDLADQAAKQTGGIARNLDGRRRVVMVDDDRRLLDRTIRMLRKHGLGVIVGCIGTHGPAGQPGSGHLADGQQACGEALIVEGLQTHDKGYGCRCQRVHFVK